MKINRLPTKEIIKEYIDKGYYFRFQNPKRALDYNSKSWGMIYSSPEEAEEDGSTVLNGKSCTSCPYDLMKWFPYYDNSYVVLVFEGADTRESGHDGEYVCKVLNVIDCFDRNAFCDIFRNIDGDFINYYEWEDGEWLSK